MIDVALHHVSVPTTNLEVSSQFYEQVLGLKRMQRPPFPIDGVWYAIGPLQLHLTVHVNANFRAGKRVDNDDIHFALKTGDIERAIDHLRTHGYNDQLPQDHPMKLIVKRTGLAGFPQVFLMDPERNIIELNEAPFNPLP
jgi:glyoxylase I family protein